MPKTLAKVAITNNYLVVNVNQAKEITNSWLEKNNIKQVVSTGLPEIDDRYHIWRVPLIHIDSKKRLGELVIDARSSLIDANRTTKPEIIESRILNRDSIPKQSKKRKTYILSNLRNTIALGDAEEVLKEFPAESIDLIFTSPPYYNARPEYSDFLSYQDYLLKLKKIIHACHRVLRGGRFFVMNISPVLVRRASRNESSKRIAVPFDIHRIFMEEGFDFIDDIIWEKPEGAGWATGRGRRFAADRNPLQYKPVPVTEYVLVYRKQSEDLIDWHIRNHPNKSLVNQSKIDGNYDRTNIWKITPAHSKIHPAMFPLELAKKVIRYYSFKGDVVLDPFAGVGTVAEAAILLERRFACIDIEKRYVDATCERLRYKLGEKFKEILFLGYAPPKVTLSTTLKDYLDRSDNGN